MNEETQKQTDQDIEVLLKEIRRKAEAESGEIIKETEKSAEQKRSSAEAQADRIREEAKERAEARAESVRETKMANLAMQKKRTRLRQNEELMQLIMQETAQEIEKRSGTEEYGEVLKKWAVEACLGLGADSVELQVSSRERKFLEKEGIEEVRNTVRGTAGGDIAITLADNDHSGAGVKARSSDGRLQYDNRVVTRIRRQKNTIRRIIYKELIQKGTV